jgi:hypothetical protein
MRYIKLEQFISLVQYLLVRLRQETTHRLCPALILNLMLSLKNLSQTNTLTYVTPVQVTNKKFIETLVHYASVIKLFLRQ